MHEASTIYRGLSVAGGPRLLAWRVLRMALGCGVDVCVCVSGVFLGAVCVSWCSVCFHV